MFNIKIETNMFQYFHHNLPIISMNVIFQRNCETHEHDTRHRHDPHSSNRRKTLTNGSFIT